MFLLKGIVIGMFVSFPIGPLGLLSIQRTINKGWKIGFISAVGAAASDLIYSSLAILGISFIDNFVNKHRCVISGLTGILFVIVGISILSSGAGKIKNKEDKEGEGIHPFFVHFFMGLSNPMTFLIFYVIFTKIGIYVEGGTFLQHIIFVILIFVGSSIQWLITTNLIEESKKKYKFECFIFIDKIIGIVIILFGVFSIIKGTTRFYL
ncbi:MAG: LysE family translocator [Clostridium sp.]|uniref:LysE family translocator n=1 Tax=Clostridium sp. TaxID=1506 RepID=UPI003D6D31F8